MESSMEIFQRSILTYHPCGAFTIQHPLFSGHSLSFLVLMSLSLLFSVCARAGESKA